MRDVIDILTTLEVKGGKKNVYEEDFEGVFLGRSTEFYRNESEVLLESCDAATYLRKVRILVRIRKDRGWTAYVTGLPRPQAESRLSEEQNRCAHYLSAKTLKPLLAILDTELLSNHLSTILNMSGSGLVSMLDDDKYGDLQRLYKLFGRPGVTEGLDVLKAALKRSILARGTAINEGIAVGPSSGAASTVDATNNDMDVNAPNVDQATPFSLKAKGKGKETYPLMGQSEGAPATGSGMSAAASAVAALRWVQDVLDLKDKFDRILKDGFSDDKGIQTAINEVGCW
jgi:cullin 3